MAEKPSGTGVLEVTLGMRVNLNVYGPDGKPVAYNKCELWAEVKAADSASARAELDAQVERMMGDYARSFGPNASESPLDKKSDVHVATAWSDDQRKFVEAFVKSVGSFVPTENKPFETWKQEAIAAYGKERYDAFRAEYVKANPKKS